MKRSQPLNPVSEMGLHALPGGLGSQLSWVLRAMEQGYQWSGTAQLPLLAPHRARFCPEKLHMATNWNLHLFWWLDTCFPFCRCYCHFLRYGETQQPFQGGPANWISRLQSSKPKARVQEYVHHIHIPGVSKFPSAFAVPVVGRSFPVAWAERGWKRGIFCTCFLKRLPIPLPSVLLCWGPVICFLAQCSRLAFARLQPLDWISTLAAALQRMETRSPHGRLQPFLKPRVRVRERLSCTSAPLSRDISRDDFTG